MPIKIAKSSLLILSIFSAELACSTFPDSSLEALPPQEFLSGINFANPQHYLDYLKCKVDALPATLIVGNGRGEYSNGTRIDVRNYGRGAYSYLLMDFVQGVDTLRGVESFTPDLNCDVLQLQQFAVEHDMAGKLDIVILENLPACYAFTPNAVTGALTCLKPGGHLIISSFPMIGDKVDAEGLSLIRQYNSNSVELGDYTWFYNEVSNNPLAFLSVPQIIKVRNLDSGPQLMPNSPFEEVATFLNGYKESFIDYFGEPAKSQIDGLEFTTVSYVSRFWPQMPNTRLNASGPQLKPVMMITKK
ncbi:MAG: hypothetical protein LBL30_03935 [Holosporales bacterium]|jgi:SAM-dependent methyltransferase|nr:hypothetical protein [Holosporales bacterium]